MAYLAIVTVAAAYVMTLNSLGQIPIDHHGQHRRISLRLSQMRVASQAAVNVAARDLKIGLQIPQMSSTVVLADYSPAKVVVYRADRQ